MSQAPDLSPYRYRTLQRIAALQPGGRLFHVTTAYQAAACDWLEAQLLIRIERRQNIISMNDTHYVMTAAGDQLLAAAVVEGKLDKLVRQQDLIREKLRRERDTRFVFREAAALEVKYSGQRRSRRGYTTPPTLAIAYDIDAFDEAARLLGGQMLDRILVFHDVARILPSADVLHYVDGLLPAKDGPVRLQAFAMRIGGDEWMTASTERAVKMRHKKRMTALPPAEPPLPAPSTPEEIAADRMDDDAIADAFF